MTKKRIGIVFLLVLTLVGIGFWYVFIYQPFSVVFHQKADSCIVINVKKSKQDLFSHLWDARNELPTDSLQSYLQDFQSSSIALPNYLVAYTVNKEKKVWYVPIQVRDTLAFTSFLKKQGFVKHTNWQKKGKQVMLSVAYNAKQEGLLAISMDENKEEEIHTILKEALFLNKTLPKEHEVYQKIKNTSHHALFLDQINTTENMAEITMDFTKSKLLIAGKYPTRNSWLGKQEVNYVSTYPAYVVANVSREKLVSWVNKPWFKQKTSIDLDSLFTYYTSSGFIAYEGVEETTDTILTYDYDENFNPITVSSVKTKTNPKIITQWYKQNDGLPWLLNDSLVKPIDTNLRLVAMPLFALYFSQNHEWVSFSSKPAIVPTNATFKGVGKVFVDGKQIPWKKLGFPYAPYLGQINTINLEVNQLANSLLIKGEIEFKTIDKHFILGFLE